MASFGKKTRNPGWKSGDHWVECERTGMIIRSSDARIEWTGAIVAKEEWEPRHPQDYIRGVVDRQAAEGIVSLESKGTQASFNGLAIAGRAVAGDAITGTTYTSTIPEGTFNTNTLP